MLTRRETTTRYKNLLYLSTIISTSYEAKNDVTAVLSNICRRDFEWPSMLIIAIRNHDAKPRYETSTRNKNLLYLSALILKSYEACGDAK